MLTMTVLCGLAYPLFVLGIGQLAFGDRADGSFVRDAGGTVIGSKLIGQGFADPGYFWSRPSVAGDGYDGTASGGSNLGPTNPNLIDTVSQRVDEYRTANDLAPEVRVPIDAVTASGSGLDPDISVANAMLQAPRIATTRGIPLTTVVALIDEHTRGGVESLIGTPAVRVLEINLALDAAT
jgi:potassium-transporting ATPase KdpC subunit